MNTIQVTTEHGVINYTESEVLRFIQKVDELDGFKQNAIDNRHRIRDFFSEGQWDDGEFTASKEDINDLLESIGANKLTSTYSATYTITGTFSIECEDVEEAEALFTDNVRVEFYDGDIDVDQIDVEDIEEAE
jgi:hypothetical protein